MVFIIVWIKDWAWLHSVRYCRF